jgi:hypothetical protein
MMRVPSTVRHDRAGRRGGECLPPGSPAVAGGFGGRQA